MQQGIFHSQSGLLVRSAPGQASCREINPCTSGLCEFCENKESLNPLGIVFAMGWREEWKRNEDG